MTQRPLACPNCKQKYLSEWKKEYAAATYSFRCVECNHDVHATGALPILVYKLDSNGAWDFVDTIGSQQSQAIG